MSCHAKTFDPLSGQDTFCGLNEHHIGLHDDGAIRWRDPPVFLVGDHYVVKDEVWREWCFRHQTDWKPFMAQPVTQLPTDPKYLGYVMLAFPFYWWKADELVPVDD